MQTRTLLPALVVFFLSPSLAPTAFAQGIRLQGNVKAQDEFRALSDDLGAALSYRGPTPARDDDDFDFGVSATATRLVNTDKYSAALSNSGTLATSTVQANKGLPMGFDVGASYSSGNGIRHAGGALRYSLIPGDAVLPSVGLRGSVTRMSSEEELDLSTRGLDLSVSKGYAYATPYAGFGRVWINSTPRILPNTLSAENFSFAKYYVGVGLKITRVNVNVEADRTGEATSYSAKFGIRF